VGGWVGGCVGVCVCVLGSLWVKHFRVNLSFHLLDQEPEL
jgi:hypothetical protein